MEASNAFIRNGIDALIVAHNKRRKASKLPKRKKGWLLREVYFKGLPGWASKSDDAACQIFNDKTNATTTNKFTSQEQRRATQLLE